jgi:hypothetical protein
MLGVITGAISRATELKELTLVVEAPQVAGLGRDCERKDRADTRHSLETPEIRVFLQVDRSSLFQLVAQLTKTDHLTEHNCEQ